MGSTSFKLRINTWLVNFRKYLFFYKDGYYELPYLCNSPQIMLASFKSMPYTRYDEANNYIETNNPFTNGRMYFRELSEGLWIIITEIEFEKNVSTHALYDNAPCDYYFLSHFRYTHKLKKAILNETTIPEVGWGLYKPGTAMNAYFEAGDKGIFMDIIFSKDWFDKNISLDNSNQQNSLKQYLDSDKAFKIWEDIVVGSKDSVDKMLRILKDPTAMNNSYLNLKIACLDLMLRFLQSIAALHLNTEKETLNELDRRHLATAERMLINSLTTRFMGISTLAKSAHMSPTKLKTLFKREYGKSILQYYQEKQMELALQLLKHPGASVKDVSHTLGFENPSYFTSTFKKHHQFLPSEVR